MFLEKPDMEGTEAMSNTVPICCVSPMKLSFPTMVKTQGCRVQLSRGEFTLMGKALGSLATH